MKTAHWLLKYGTILGIVCLLVSILIYLYVYGRVIRILKRLEMKYLSILIINSYLFAFGLYCLLVSHGVI